jgi:hypothetical protein
MFTLTADVLSTIASPVSTATIAPIDPALDRFVNDVIMLDEAGILADVLAPAAKPAPAPVRKAKPAVKPVVTVNEPTVGTGAAMKANWNGQMMKSAKGTASSGQVKFLVKSGVKPATAKGLSMVAASNMRAKLTGKI